MSTPNALIAQLTLKSKQQKQEVDPELAHQQKLLKAAATNDRDAIKQAFSDMRAQCAEQKAAAAKIVAAKAAAKPKSTISVDEKRAAQRAKLKQLLQSRK